MYAGGIRRLVAFACVLAGCGRFGFDARGDGDARAESDSVLPIADASEIQCSGGVDCAVQIEVGGWYACARMASGRVACWGAVPNGMSGLPVDTVEPVLIGNVEDAVDLALGSEHGCVIRRGGMIACWGINDQGEFGAASPASSSVALDLPTLPRAARLAASREMTCAIDGTGLVWCWGVEPGGQQTCDQGMGWSGSLRTPHPIGAWSDVRDIALGASHVCVIHADGHMSCFGTNLCGELGNANLMFTGTPVAIALPTMVARMSLGSAGSAVILDDRQIFVWGENRNDALGVAAPTRLLAPTRAEFLPTATSLAVSQSGICAGTPGSEVVCDGLESIIPSGGGPIAGTDDAVALRVSSINKYVLTSDGRVLAWGYNPNGQLGDGTMNDRLQTVAPVHLPQ